MSNKGWLYARMTTMPSRETMLASRIFAMKGKLSSTVAMSEENLFKLRPTRQCHIFFKFKKF